MNIFGAFIVLLGVVCLLFGDRTIKTEGGVILKTFSWGKGQAKFLKWPIGLALIYAGIMIAKSS